MFPPSTSASPSLYHWKLSGSVPPAKTLNVAFVPALIIRLKGWVSKPGAPT